MEKRIHIVAPPGGQRLDVFLHAQYPEFSRAVIQKHITQGRISVNGRTVTAHYRLREGDTIAGTLEPPAEIELTPDAAIDWQTLEATPDYLVINKPAGLVVHPSEGTKRGTLVNGLLAKYPSIAQVGDDLVRPGIVHRLDKEVAGLMIVALTQPAFEYFKKQFQTHAVSKKYSALVYGADLPATGEITFPLQRSKDGKMVSVPESGRPSDEAKWAKTEYEVLERFPNHTFVRVTTFTGRTHQIRAHFHGIGHPLVGDTLYQIKRFINTRHWDWLFLCADYLLFTDPAGRKKEYSLPLPKPFSDALSELRDG